MTDWDSAQPAPAAARIAIQYSFRVISEREPDSGLRLVADGGVARTREGFIVPADVAHLRRQLESELIEKADAESGQRADLVAMGGDGGNFVVAGGAVGIVDVGAGADSADVAVFGYAEQVEMGKKSGAAEAVVARHHRQDPVIGLGGLREVGHRAVVGAGVGAGQAGAQQI